MTVRSPALIPDRRKPGREVYVVIVRHGSRVDHERFHELDKAQQFIDRLVAEGAELIPNP